MSNEAEREIGPSLSVISGRLGEISAAIESIKAALVVADRASGRMVQEARSRAAAIVTAAEHKAATIDKEIERRKKLAFDEVFKPAAAALEADIAKAAGK